MRAKPQSITELPPSPDAERHSRMIKYAIAQGIRVLCIVAIFVIPLSWWTLIPAAGAVFLPYFAVVAANNIRHGGATTVRRPGAIVPVSSTSKSRADA